jgi:TPR repeat protein
MNADAQSNLGLMYDKGNGVPQDYQETVTSSSKFGKGLNTSFSMS